MYDDSMEKWMFGPPEEPVDVTEKVISEVRDTNDLRCAIVLSDVHFPDVDAPSWAIALAAIRDVDPTDVIIIGDFLELDSQKNHAPTDLYSPDLLTEYKCGRAGLRQIDMALDGANKKYLRKRPKKVKKYFFEGNHEWRFNRKLAAGGRGDVAKMIPPPHIGLGLERLGWEWIDRDQQPYKIGDLFVHHGDYFSKHHAFKHLEEWAVDQIYGHTHRQQSVTKRIMDYNSPTNELAHGKEVAVTGLGCLRRLTKDWHHMKKMCVWTNGFAVIEWHGDIPNVYPILIRHHADGTSSAAYGQHRWRVKREE